jgi:hypothetical protein
MPPALDVARRYAEAVAAMRAIKRFDTWLGDHWHQECPGRDTAPAATTDVGAEDAITWYEGAEMIVGYLPGEVGCFRIPREAALPYFPLVGDGPPPATGNDILISAEMREQQQPAGN